MSLIANIRRGHGPVYGRLKSVARRVLQFHIPVAGPTRWLFGGLYRLHVAMREWVIWAKRFFWFEPLFRSQCESVGERFQLEVLPYIVGSGRIRIGRNVRLSGKPSIAFSSNSGDEVPRLLIGDGTFIGHACTFNIARSISIGRNCLLAGGLQVQDHDGHPLDADERRAGLPAPLEAVKPVTIGDDVWIGNGAIILKGVRVGDRAVVGARSVVTRDVLPDVVVAGNPARLIRSLNAVEPKPVRATGPLPHGDAQPEARG
jgi:acetyltransferase-like isoleucine patch superfamily enzyme